MQALVIEGMRPLQGSVRVHGSKNGVLPLLAASLLARGQTVLHRCPRLTDVETTAEILRHLGAACDREGETFLVDATTVTGTAIPEELMRRLGLHPGAELRLAFTKIGNDFWVIRLK